MVDLYWRRIVVRLEWEAFARNVVALMENASEEQRSAFAGLAAIAEERRMKLQLRLAGNSVTPTTPAAWPPGWDSFDLELTHGPVLIEHNDPTQVLEVIEAAGSLALAMTVSLLPLSEDVAESDEGEALGLPEGAVKQVVVNRYERNRLNRLLCLERFGTKCAACDVELGDRYGPIGAGYIHVHHIVPVSELGEGYVVNPLTDLIPVCPNCHAMLHRRTPPMAVNDLRQTLLSEGGP